jgi:hypothetical protein
VPCITSTTDGVNRVNRPVDTGAMNDAIDRMGRSPTEERRVPGQQRDATLNYELSQEIRMLVHGNRND